MLIEGENMYLKAIEIAKELPNEHQLLADLENNLKKNREGSLASDKSEQLVGLLRWMCIRIYSRY